MFFADLCTLEYAPMLSPNKKTYKIKHKRRRITASCILINNAPGNQCKYVLCHTVTDTLNTSRKFMSHCSIFEVTRRIVFIYLFPSPSVPRIPCSPYTNDSRTLFFILIILHFPLLLSLIYQSPSVEPHHVV